MLVFGKVSLYFWKSFLEFAVKGSGLEGRKYQRLPEEIVGLEEVSAYKYTYISAGRSNLAIKEISTIMVYTSGNCLLTRYRLGDCFACCNTDDTDEGVGFFYYSGTYYSAYIALSSYRP